MKLWGGRFTKPTHRWVEEFNASIAFDQELAEEDIQGSIAHAKMLGASGIIRKEEQELIIQGLKRIYDRIQKGEMTYSIEHEDIHMNIEKMLIDEIGPVGGKLHTARSRNDQVALDLHLYLRKQIVEVIHLLDLLQQALIIQAEENIDAILPGYTHLQRAQPVRFAHHLLAYVSMFERDMERLIDSYKRVDICPLGAGALAGTPHPIDREFTAQQLGFKRIYDNSMDAVSDRDFVVEFLSNASLLMIHLSRLCEEIILWTSDEFGYVELDDAFCTGSSMMPQKKNPDIPELIRGKTGRVSGHLMGMLMTLKALPLTYNKDLQEDKEGLFDTVYTVKGSLRLMAVLIETMKVKKEQMRIHAESGFGNATDLADYLVKKGVPFREAHEVVGRLVLDCLNQGKQLLDLSLDQFRQASPLIDADVYQALSLESIVEARDCFGGTAKRQVEETLSRKKKRLEAVRELITEWLSSFVKS